jgi:hypothetical protein
LPTPGGKELNCQLQVGGWRSVVVLQQGWQDTQLITPPPHTSYRTISFVIADSVTGTVPTMLL